MGLSSAALIDEQMQCFVPAHACFMSINTSTPRSWDGCLAIYKCGSAFFVARRFIGVFHRQSYRGRAIGAIGDGAIGDGAS